MTIGEAAAASCVSAKMIRYYEAIGLLAAPLRSGAGYRVFTQADVATLQFIGRARAFGMAMPLVRQMVGLWQDQGRASRDVKRLALQQVGELRARVAELQSMADALQALADGCHGNDRPDCPSPGRPGPGWSRLRSQRGRQTGAREASIPAQAIPPRRGFPIAAG